MEIGGLHYDILVIVVAIIVAYVLYKLLKPAKKLAINIIVGFLLILLSNWLIPGVYVPLWNWVTIIVTALTGALGAIVLIILSFFGLFPF